LERRIGKLELSVNKEIGMLREMGLSGTVKKEIPKEQCVFIARRRGNDELAPSDEIFHELKEFGLCVKFCELV